MPTTVQQRRETIRMKCAGGGELVIHDAPLGDTEEWGDRIPNPVGAEIGKIVHRAVMERWTAAEYRVVGDRLIAISGPDATASAPATSSRTKAAKARSRT